jgi:PAS domain S-box-containing protein
MSISLRRRRGEQAGRPSDWRGLIKHDLTAGAELKRLRKTERTMIGVRWAGVVFGFVQALTFYKPYPPGVLTQALTIVGLLGVGNLFVSLAHRRTSDIASARRLSRRAMVLDAVMIVGMVFLYTFDAETSIWALIYIIPLEGAIRFRLRGALVAMALATVAYFFREVYGSAMFHNEFLLTSISFRMGLGFLIAAVAGGMATNLDHDRAELELANRKHQSLLDALGHLGEGLVIAEANQILFANDALQGIVGYSAEELMSIPSLLSLVAPEDQAGIAERMAGDPNTPFKEESFEVAAIHQQGRRIHLEVGLQPLDSQEETKVLAVIRDVTQRKLAEEKLAHALEREREAVRRLETLDEAKSDFLSTVSHELRTPVTTIGGFATMLQHRWDVLTDGQKSDFVRRIGIGAAQLNRLIAELLDFTRLERGEAGLMFLHLDVRGEILKTLETAGPLLDGHWFTVDAQDNIEMIADAHAFSRILENLLTNAAKFSPPGSTISIGAAAHSHDEVLIEVKDEGVGIRPQDRTKIFERFFRAHRGNTTPSGTGIGLAVVKELVQAQGGQVWTTPNNTKGAVFSFTLKRPALHLTHPTPLTPTPAR